MAKQTMYEDVKDFHKKYNLTFLDKPTLPDTAERNHRIRLLDEEWGEYLEGEKNNDIVEIADGLCDMLYIIFGTAIAYGIPIDKVFDEIHRSNMTKVKLPGEAKLTKGALYSKPDLKPILGL